MLNDFLFSDNLLKKIGYGLQKHVQYAIKIKYVCVEEQVGEDTSETSCWGRWGEEIADPNLPCIIARLHFRRNIRRNCGGGGTYLIRALPQRIQNPRFYPALKKMEKE